MTNTDSTYSRNAQIFERARNISERVSRNQSHQEVAWRLAHEAVLTDHPQLSADEQRRLELTKEYKVAKSSVGQYAIAWKTVEDAGLIPDPATVTAAFRIVQGGNATERHELIARSKSRPISERERAFLEDCKGLTQSLIGKTTPLSVALSAIGRLNNSVHLTQADIDQVEAAVNLLRPSSPQHSD